LKPDYHNVFEDWGLALYEQAKTKAGEEANHLFEEAGRKYAEAIRLKPDFYEAFNNWGVVLFYQASHTAGTEANHVLQQAREKLLKAEEIRPGSGAYNLARIDALEGNTKEAIHWLQVAESTGTRLSRAKIAAEKGFDRVRDQPEFVSFMESLAGE
jgi:tetratricopeptide (TPR) repeat protein